MTRAAQKHEEIFYAGEFLRNQLKLNVIDVKPAVKEPPDCSATITNPDGTTVLLDFEIAEYYVEVRFKEPVSLRNGQVDQFADELIRFAQEFCPERHLERTAHDAFSAALYALLHEHVERIALTRLEGTVVIGWHCSNIAAAFVGVVRSHLGDLVCRKSAKNFTWVSGAEKCLLIYASGETVTSRAGPPPPDPSIWDDNDLVSACTGSVFDRIYFWERVLGWYKRLK
jgi:hypothetical protein